MCFPVPGRWCSRDWVCNMCASMHTVLCSSTSPLTSLGTRAFPQPCPPLRIRPHAMGRRGGQGEEGKFLPCFQGDGKSRNGGKAAFPPPMHARSRQQRNEPPYSQAPHGTCGQSSGSLWCSGSGVSPGPLCRCPGHGASLVPLSCSIPWAPSTIACSGIVSTMRGQKPPPSRAA